MTRSSLRSTPIWRGSFGRTELDSVYYIRPDGKVLRVADDIERPNGVQLGRDEKTLYVANTGLPESAFSVPAPGSISHLT